jgi:hypothetical protein
VLQVKFLKSVPLLANLPPDLLARMSDVLEMEIFKVRLGQSDGVWARLVAFKAGLMTFDWTFGLG